MTFTHILFPVDFSTRAHGAAAHVATMAKHFGSKVTLLNVAGSIGYDTVSGLPLLSEPEFIIDQDLQGRLTDFATKELPGVKSFPVIARGEAAAAITKFAHERDVDLIMMPSHGYGPFRRLLLGSITAKVLHDADCPVWTSAHTEDDSEDNHIPYKKILCAVDLSPRTERLITWSAELTKALRATLRFVHAVPSDEISMRIPRYGKDLVEELQQKGRERMEHFQKEAGLSSPACVSLGSPGDVVRDEARQHQVDLIVIGRGCIKENLGRLRTHAYSIIRQAPCPVISI